MGSIFFLFRRKFTYSARWVLLITGYDLRQKDFMERLYGVYIAIILAGWVLLMLAWAVSSVAQALAKTTLAGQLYVPLFYVLALWLAVTPWLAQRAYDLYRFSLPDLDFLSNAPIRPPLIAVSWFLKSLFTRLNGLFVLGAGVLAGAIGQMNGRGDLLGLIEGLAAGMMFVVSVWAFLWLLGLLRYRPVPALGALQAYGLSGVLLAVLFVWREQQVFWPAWLASSLVSGHSPAPHWGTWAVVGLSATALAGLAGIFLLSRTTLLTPAFEEGRLGGQLRRAASLGMLSSGEARMQSSLERRLARGAALPGISASASGGRSGVVGALLRKQQLRLIRLPLVQLLLTVLSPLLLGAVVAVAISVLPRVALRIEVLAPAVFMGAFLLMRSGAEILRGDLAHIDFFAGWPISRSSLLAYDLALGFVLPLVGGEITVLAAGLGLAAPALTVLGWLVLWPLLVAMSALAMYVDFRRLLGKWAATPETLPEVGPAPVVVAAVIWLLIVFEGASAGLFA